MSPCRSACIKGPSGMNEPNSGSTALHWGSCNRADQIRWSGMVAPVAGQTDIARMRPAWRLGGLHRHSQAAAQPYAWAESLLILAVMIQVLLQITRHNHTTTSLTHPLNFSLIGQTAEK